MKHLTIPLYSEWFGNVWEDLIRAINICFYKTMGHRRINYFDMLMIVSDIQNSINSRLLTNWYSEDSGLEVIPPNHLIRPNYNGGVILRVSDKEMFRIELPSKIDIVKIVEIHNILFEKFPRSWLFEYLLNLREQSKDLNQHSFCYIIRIDDLVLIKNSAKTLWWPVKKRKNINKPDHSKTLKNATPNYDRKWWNHW